MALARCDGLRFAYPDACAPALDGVSLHLREGEVVALLGASGSGKSTLLRALGGLVPHFHGGRFEGRVDVAGRDTRRHGPAELAGVVASVFQDPEEQIVLGQVEREVAFGLENIGAPPEQILPRAHKALLDVGAGHLALRATGELSGGELQRVCLAAALALGPRLVLLDEPTSQLDPDAAESFLELVAGLGSAVLIAEQRPARVLEHVDRVLFLDDGRLVLDAPVTEARAWLADHHPAWLGLDEHQSGDAASAEVCGLTNVSFSYGERSPVVDGFDLTLRRGEIVAVSGPSGSGKTTIAKLAAGLLVPGTGHVHVNGRAAMLLQDPGRYCICERVEDEVALGVAGDRDRARRALACLGLEELATRHPRDLSSGERERVALAAVLVVEPDLLVLDEPTRGVDPERKDELASLLRRDAARRATLVVTHDEEFAEALADRRVFLARERALV